MNKRPARKYPQLTGREVRGPIWLSRSRGAIRRHIRRGTARPTLVAGSGLLAVAIAFVATAFLGVEGVKHFMGDAAPLCASDRWRPWTAATGGEPGFSLAPFGLECTYPHFADGSPVHIYPDEPYSSLAALALVLTALAGWFILTGQYRARAVQHARARKVVLRTAGALMALVWLVTGLATLVYLYALRKNGMTLSCIDYASQPAASVGSGPPEGAFDGITSSVSLIPTGILCSFPTSTNDPGLLVFGFYENAGAGSISVIAGALTILCFVLAARTMHTTNGTDDLGGDPGGNMGTAC